jgi:hypothetical protein
LHGDVSSVNQVFNMTIITSGNFFNTNCDVVDYSTTHILSYLVFFYLVCEAIGTAATPGLLCQPRVIVKMIVEKQMEC